MSVDMSRDRTRTLSVCDRVVETGLGHFLSVTG